MKVQPPNTTVVVAAAAATSFLLYYMATKKKSTKKVKADRQLNRASHLRIQTPDLDQSLLFYQSLGFQTVQGGGGTEKKYILLKCPGQKLHQPYILLEYTPDFQRVNRHAANLGYGRFAVFVADVHAEVERLKQQGYNPIAPPVTDRPGSPLENGQPNKEPPVTIVAFKDPATGVQAELMSMKSSLIKKGIIKVMGIRFPLMVHVNVNASNYPRSREAYQQLGFSKTGKYYGKVVNKLYKALNIPHPGVANEVCLIKTPTEDIFSIDLIEWDNIIQPAGLEAKGAIPSPIRLALTVDDLPLYTDQLAQTGNWTLVRAPRTESLPYPMSKAAITTILTDPDGVQIELVQADGVDEILQDTKSKDSNKLQKVVLITGCDSGFGRSLAVQAAALSFAVVAACYTPEGAEYLKGVATTVVADLSQEKGPGKVVEACQTLLLKNKNAELYAVINNAAYCAPGNVEWTHPNVYKRAMAVNVHAPIAIIYGLIPHLKQAKGSRVIQISSVCGFLSQPTNTPYCTTKHALESYSDGLRAEMRPFGIQVCIVQPATMRTPIGTTYWQTWKKGYLEAPAERQTSLKKDKLDAFVENEIVELEKLAEDSRVTIRAIMKALVQDDKPLPTRLRTGKNAGMFRMLSWLPDKSRDGLLYARLNKNVHV